MHVAQPALSRQIGKLEEELEAQLLIRHGRGVVLTEVGEHLLKRSVQILADLSALEDEVRNRGSAVRLNGNVGVGLPSNLSHLLAAPLQHEAGQLYPEISLHVVEGYINLMHEWVMSGSINLAIIYNPPANSLVATRELVVERLFLVVPAASTLAQAFFLSRQDVAKQTNVIPHRPHALWDVVDRAGMNLERVIKTDSLGGALNFVRSGQGCALLPATVLANEHSKEPSLVAVPIEPPLTWTVTLCWASTKPLSSAVAAIAGLIVDNVHRLVTEQRWLADFVD
jgi:LysR family nitrogen assimilation transcriptional regulator